MDYPKTKEYFDGSHFIGIPPEKQIRKFHSLLQMYYYKKEKIV